MNILTKIGLIAAIVLPLWNIPLIVRMYKRKSSKDISLYWVFGVWVCLALMLPAGIKSADIVFKAYTILNVILFSAVVICAIFYRKGE